MRTGGRAWHAMLLACACVTVTCAAHAASDRPAAETHGASDAFASPGVALAWGVLRGQDEAGTYVVVRLEADPAAYASVGVAGVDPFTRSSQALAPVAPINGTIEIRVSRARFADLPRTEWRLYKSIQPSVGEAPALLVYYQGIPDTTPEFTDEGRLRADLVRRIERARRESGGSR